MTPRRTTTPGGRDARPAVAALRERPDCTVLIIGGGINGVATFRDLALQGVDVTLIDRGDIAAATSAASSRMIHGGLRYLENGEFRLVKEAVAERNGLLATAPHCVTPLPTTIPIHQVWSGLGSAPRRFLTGHGSSRHAARGAVLIKAGLTLYDEYSHAGLAPDGTGVPRHSFTGRVQSLEDLPDLDPSIICTATYYDAAVRAPERLALEMALDALATHPGARLATYVEATGASSAGVEVRDVLTGDTVTLRPRLVVNASGPWTDLTNAALGEATAFMGGTKGSHIVVDNPALHEACRGREIFFENEDGRIVLIHPQHGRVILGTSDIPADPREPAVCTAEEIDYFIDLAARVFPGIPVTREQIVHRFAGIRPLPAADAASPGEIPRDYRLVTSELPGGVPLVSLVGGKWTTHRALGEKIADQVLELLGRARRTSTRGVPVGGGRDYPRPDDRPEWIAAHMPGDDARAGVLLDRYGTRGAEVAALETRTFAWFDEARTLRHAPGYTRAEIQWIARTERVARLADLVQRRTQLTFRGEVTVPLLEELAKVVGRELGWSRKRRAAEVELVLEQARAARAGDVALTGRSGQASPTSVTPS
ncbi:glycerol-3-phosphate dehydrogenase/oxidase [Demequina phytophila]|uniref:glycerol-3-phosphate dehydrogenase/oxidase n=1 Tax=Demequina phytophila TaxID=1638981 RepID=UPI00078079F9|nr:glycerol-3-phosphate dehydrogenase/oxidase [Demequina phytophila]